MGARQREGSAGGSSFYYSFLLLSRARREAILAVYGFLRMADDAVDEPGAVSLEFWSDELERVYRGEPRHAIGRRLQRAVAEFELRREYFEDLLRGCAMDRDVSRYATFEHLASYCRLVASAVGRLCLPIFGASEVLSGAYADALGLALQMTNILRDVGEDAARGRIYLPLEDLEAFGVAEEDLLQRRGGAGVDKLLRFEGERARALFGAARRALPDRRAERRRLLAAEVMRAIYHALLVEMRRRGYPALREKVALSRWCKASLAARTWVRVRLGLPSIGPSMGS